MQANPNLLILGFFLQSVIFIGSIFSVYLKIRDRLITLETRLDPLYDRYKLCINNNCPGITELKQELNIEHKYASGRIHEIANSAGIFLKVFERDLKNGHTD